jgi:uncharacterized protein (TIGR03067 family)
MENHMAKNLPARADLDHLRRQAKALLADLRAGDTQAVKTLKEHLPTARGLTAHQIRAANFRLADAQSAIARKTGFATWPNLARHVEQLRALEGTWGFVRLEVDGTVFPAATLSASRILIDGDRFRTESPEATYEGVFNINVEAQPHEIDIEFIAGPEAGNSNYGIFQFDDSQLEICLDMNGNPRPHSFSTSAGSGHAYETLQRTSATRPTNVTGGSPSDDDQSSASSQAAIEDFHFVESPTLTRLQGNWIPTKIIRDGQQLPAMMLRTGIRIAKQNEVTISFGAQTMIHALVRIDEQPDPMHVDYYDLDSPLKGTIQLGILEWAADEACFCMASSGNQRPTDFKSPAGTGHTLSRWKRKI